MMFNVFQIILLVLGTTVVIINYIVSTWTNDVMASDNVLKEMMRCSVMFLVQGAVTALDTHLIVHSTTMLRFHICWILEPESSI